MRLHRCGGPELCVEFTVSNVQPGPIDTDLNPATGDWADGGANA
jgi:hypothetical protein